MLTNIRDPSRQGGLRPNAASSPWIGSRKKKKRYVLFGSSSKILDAAAPGASHYCERDWKGSLPFIVSSMSRRRLAPFLENETKGPKPTHPEGLSPIK